MGYYYNKDKTMYQAVKLAYSYMEKTKEFSTAVKFYANKYGVDEDELAIQVRKYAKRKMKSAVK
jgi:hypothetical protein